MKSLGEDKLREFVKYGSFKLRFQTKFHLSQEIYFVDTFTLLILLLNKQTVILYKLIQLIFVV